MDKDILMNAVADIDFLLMLTAFALFLSIAAIVLMVGMWESDKELRKDYTVFLNKHNMLVKSSEAISNAIQEIITNHNLLLAQSRKLSDLYNEIISKHNSSCDYNEKMANITKTNSVMIREMSSMINDAFNDANQRIDQLEVISKIMTTPLEINAGAEISTGASV